MDDNLRGLYYSVGGFHINDASGSGFAGQNLVREFNNGITISDQNHVVNPWMPLGSVPSGVGQSVTLNPEGNSNDDFDFSDVVLKYISQMLMEEDIEEKACMFQESSALQAAEKSFYELLGEKYPPVPSRGLSSYSDQSGKMEDNKRVLQLGGSSCSASVTNQGNLVKQSRSGVLVPNLSSQMVSKTNSQSSSVSSSSANLVLDGCVESPVSTLRISEMFGDSESIMQFKRGVEEASKFLPNNGSLSVNSQINGSFLEEPKEDAKSMMVKVESNIDSFADRSRGKKNPHPEDINSEGGRSSKQTAVYTGSTERSEMFDDVLLNCQSGSALRQAFQNETSKNEQQNGQSKGSGGGKGRGRKGAKRGVVDLRTILTLCAQAVAVDDRRTAGDLLKQIRQNSSPMGDGMQRMAHYFADALEARMAGAGGKHIYKGLITKPTSAADVLKAYHLFLAACPYRKLSNFFSNKTIMNVAEKASKLHIVDFGILYGFQWPCLIRRLSSRPGGPPHLRITGVDLPQPGFRPAARVEETGRRLSEYAKTFKVPFEYHAIAQRWDTIKVEDLKIGSDEVLVVNCVFRLRNIPDETVIVESPRDIVLNLIRKMKPVVFILGIVNGAYSAPFFTTRFREALFHYSTLFDMLEANVPREIPERMLIEKEIFGWEAMNVIACEGSERIERPETYKQCQARILRAGFTPVPLNQEIMTMAKDRVKSYYNKDFLIDEDSPWLLQGWKGRITYGLSSWKPGS